MKRILELVFSLLLAGALDGCATRSSGYRITNETIAFIQPGSTTRSEIIENLGPPLFELTEPHVVAYSWGRVHLTTNKAPSQEQSFQPAPAGVGGYAAPPSPSPWEEEDSVESRRWICCVALNEKNVVTRTGKFEIKEATSLENAVRQWATSGTAPVP